MLAGSITKLFSGVEKDLCYCNHVVLV